MNSIEQWFQTRKIDNLHLIEALFIDNHGELDINIILKIIILYRIFDNLLGEIPDIISCFKEIK